MYSNRRVFPGISDFFALLIASNSELYNWDFIIGMKMENILFLSSRVVFLISAVLFGVSFFVNKLFNNAAPDDLLAPAAQAIAHLMSNGVYYLAIGCLILAVIKFIYEWTVDSY